MEILRIEYQGYILDITYFSVINILITNLHQKLYPATF